MLQKRNKKSRVFPIIFVLFMMMGIAGAQPHISTAFILEDEWTLKESSERFPLQGMVGCVEDNILYFCHRRGFQNKENAYKAVVTRINLSTGEESGFTLCMPEKKANVSLARKYWIRGICVEGDQLFIMVQNAVLVYQKGKGDRCEFVKRIDVDLPDRLDLDNGRMTIVERVPEEGRFVVKKRSDRSVALDSVMAVNLPAPFMIQYEPNGFVKMAAGSLYFLAAPNLRIEKYSFKGDSRVDIEPLIPGWVPIPEELVRKISEMPYSSDRALYTFSHTKEYSFPLEVTPLCDSVLLLSYHQYDSIEKKEGIFTALIAYDQTGRVTRVEPYTHFFPADSVIGKDAFPLYYAQRELCLQVTDGDRIVQIVREAPVEWRGQTGQQYIGSAERYFADHPPVVRVRVARLKTNVAEHSCNIGELGLRTYNGEIYDGSEHRDKKVVFILHNPPQCHDCEESLLDIMNTLDTAKYKLIVVLCNADSYLAKQDQMTNVRKNVKISFLPLFVPSDNKDNFLETLGAKSFPAVLLKEAGTMEGTVLFGRQIFGNGHSSVPSQAFIQKIKQFIYGKGGAGK